MFHGFSIDVRRMFGRCSIDVPSPISHGSWLGLAECAERLNTASPLAGSAVLEAQSRNCRFRNPILLPRSEVCGHRPTFVEAPSSSFPLIFFAFCSLSMIFADFSKIFSDLHTNFTDFFNLSKIFFRFDQMFADFRILSADVC